MKGRSRMQLLHQRKISDSSSPEMMEGETEQNKERGPTWTVWVGHVFPVPFPPCFASIKERLIKDLERKFAESYREIVRK